MTCENCGGPLGPGGGYPPPGYTTETADPADAWCETCRFTEDRATIPTRGARPDAAPMAPRSENDTMLKRLPGAVQIALGILLALLAVVLIQAVLASTNAEAFTGGGWKTTTSSTKLHWMSINGRELPCRSAVRTIHKWGVTGSGTDWHVWLSSTACEATDSHGGHLHLAYAHYTPHATACQYACGWSVQSQSSIGCWGGLNCRAFTHRVEWDVHHVFGVTFEQHWHPTVYVHWFIKPWSLGVGNIGYTSGVTCSGC